MDASPSLACFVKICWFGLCDFLWKKFVGKGSCGVFLRKVIDLE
jgi:hypothetical protein